MPTEYSTDLDLFGRVEGRWIAADFGGGVSGIANDLVPTRTEGVGR